MDEAPWVVGLTGTNGSGKGTVAAALIDRGFAYRSLSDILRDELEARGLRETVDALADLGNELREKEGGDVLARRVYESILKQGDPRAVADSIRSVPEVEYFRGKDRFILVAVDAPVDLRYKRVQERNRPGDRVSLDQFISQEDRQLRGEEREHNLLACIDAADILLINADRESDLIEELLRGLGEWGLPLEPAGEE